MLVSIRSFAYPTPSPGPSPPSPSGLFKEFLEEVSKEGFDPGRGLFAVTSDQRLYPAPGAAALVPDAPRLLAFLGQLLGKALLEGTLVDLPLATFFLQKMAGRGCELRDLASLDPELAANLGKLRAYDAATLAGLELTFTVTDVLAGEAREVGVLWGWGGREQGLKRRGVWLFRMSRGRGRGCPRPRRTGGAAVWGSRRGCDSRYARAWGMPHVRASHRCLPITQMFMSTACQVQPQLLACTICTASLHDPCPCCFRLFTPSFPSYTVGPTVTTLFQTAPNPQVELVQGGARRSVTRDNVIEYVHRMADFKLNRQLAGPVGAFLGGLHSIIPPHWLAPFSAAELQALISGGEQGLDLADLAAHARYGGGYAADHPSILLLWRALTALTAADQALFLRFVTSCPRPPLLGFKYLQPPLSIQARRWGGRGEGGVISGPGLGNQVHAPDRLRSDLAEPACTSFIV